MYYNVLAFSLGGTEYLVIAVVALLIFGRNLPTVARNMGKSVVEFKKGLKNVQDEVDSVNDDIDQEVNKNENNTGN